MEPEKLTPGLVQESQAPQDRGRRNLILQAERPKLGLLKQTEVFHESG